jgi:hypothetical protein
MKQSLPARGTPLAHGEKAKPPTTGPTFKHAYAVLSHLTGRQYPIEGASPVKPAETSQVEGKTPTSRPFSIREANTIARGLDSLDRWAQQPMATQIQAPPADRRPAYHLDEGVITEDILRQRFISLQPRLPRELHIVPEPKKSKIE